MLRGPRPGPAPDRGGCAAPRRSAGRSSGATRSRTPVTVIPSSGGARSVRSAGRGLGSPARVCREGWPRPRRLSGRVGADAGGAGHPWTAVGGSGTAAARLRLSCRAWVGSGGGGGDRRRRRPSDGLAAGGRPEAPSSAGPVWPAAVGGAWTAPGAVASAGGVDGAGGLRSASRRSPSARVGRTAGSARSCDRGAAPRRSSACCPQLIPCRAVAGVSSRPVCAGAVGRRVDRCGAGPADRRQRHRAAGSTESGSGKRCGGRGPDWAPVRHRTAARRRGGVRRLPGVERGLRLLGADDPHSLCRRSLLRSSRSLRSFTTPPPQPTQLVWPCAGRCR